MHNLDSLRAFEQIKVLSDPRRMRILRLLMAAPATLTQLAHTLGHSPAWIRHHIQTLESAGLIELSEIRRTGKVTEKYYRAGAGAFLLQKLILPRTNKPTVVFCGSHDLAIEEMARRLARHALLIILPVGSLDGLIDLRQGLCHISGAHLLDEHGGYNITYVQHFFPDREMELVTLAHRTQGLMTTPGNPKGIKRFADLARADVRFVNRNRGSGTRLWFDAELKRSGLSPTAIRGYDHAASTHTEAASLIEAGRADAALGLQAAAHQHGLDFISLFEERYDLVLPCEQEQTLAPFLEYIQSADFRQALDSLTGYNTAHSGEQISLYKEKEA
jgi:putative molybdopterin biosynthesis protein